MVKTRLLGPLVSVDGSGIPKPPPPHPDLDQGMSRGHREILHLARLLQQIAASLPAIEADRNLVRDVHRVIEANDSLVRMHSAQEQDVYDFATPAW
jgi:hypothetical protein